MAGVVEVAADPAAGFHFPYLLWLPAGDGAQPPFLLVEPNNTGSVSDDFEVHRDAARRMVADNSLGHHVAEQLRLPFLVPVFPRPETGWENYTHALDRDTLLLADAPLVRLDRQLAAMIRHARGVLAARGIEVGDRVLMNGFSASGTFANRFTFLHPEIVRATACGGINAIPMLPVAELDGTPLPYPLGLADYERVSGRPFDRDAWRAIPQLLYMGAEDDNDAVDFSDGYSDGERALVHTVLGARMLPDRWERCRQVYAASGGAATTRTYEGIGHGADRRIHDDLVAFFRGVIDAGK